MRTFIAAVGVFAATQSPAMEACPDLGVNNAYLAQQFCAQLQALSETETTRSMGTNDTVTIPDLSSDWAEVEVIQDAYRADPQKTLALIARIRKAGGLNE